MAVGRQRKEMHHIVEGSLCRSSDLWRYNRQSTATYQKKLFPVSRLQLLSATTTIVTYRLLNPVQLVEPGGSHQVNERNQTRGVDSAVHTSVKSSQACVWQPLKLATLEDGATASNFSCLLTLQPVATLVSCCRSNKPGKFPKKILLSNENLNKNIPHKLDTNRIS